MRGCITPAGLAAVAVAAVAAVGISGAANAASITWQTPTVVTSTSVLDTIPTDYSGATLSQSNYFGTDTSTYTVTTPKPQSISFSPGSTSFSGPSGTGTEVFYGGTQKLSGSPTGDSNFNNVLENDSWASSATSTQPQTLQIGGLTVGQTYAVQLLAYDPRTSSATRTEEFADTVNATGNNSASFSTASATSVVGTFTANASTESVYVWQTTPGVTSWDTTISGFTLYSVPSVPEPATLGLAAVGLTGLLLRRRRSAHHA